MSILATVAGYAVMVVQWIWTAAQFGAIGVGLWAFVDSIMRPAEHFVAADKRTKSFWLALNAASLAVVGLMGASSMFGLMGVVVGGVYLADVRPALDVFKPVRVRSRVRKPGRDDGGSAGPVSGWH